MRRRPPLSQHGVAPDWLVERRDSVIQDVFFQDMYANALQGSLSNLAMLVSRFLRFEAGLVVTMLESDADAVARRGDRVPSIAVPTLASLAASVVVHRPRARWNRSALSQAVFDELLQAEAAASDFPRFSILQSARVASIAAVLRHTPDIGVFAVPWPRALLDAHAPGSGATLVCAAAKYGRMSVVQFLLQVGASPFASSANGMTPLIAAAEAGHIDVVRILLTQPGVDVNATASSERVTALFVAAQYGRVAVVRALIIAGASVDAAKMDGATPLYVAARHDDVLVVRVLVDAGATVDRANQAGMTPLFVAAEKGCLDCVRFLHQRGADVNWRRCDGATPLAGAALHARIDVVRELIDDAGADLALLPAPHLTEVMCCAARFGDVDLLELVAEAAHVSGRLDINRPDHSGRSPIHWAISGGFEDCVQLLLGRWGADMISGHDLVARRNVACGDSALHVAVWTGRQRSASSWAPELWSQMINSRDSDCERSPLHHACFRADLDWVKRLLAPGRCIVRGQIVEYVGADATQADALGWTPLHEACASPLANRAVVEALLEHGAARVINSRTWEGGDTPIELARRRDIETLLRAHGAWGGQAPFLRSKAAQYTRAAASAAAFGLLFTVLMVPAMLQESSSRLSTLMYRVSTFERDHRGLMLWSITAHLLLALLPLAASPVFGPLSDQLPPYNNIMTAYAGTLILLLEMLLCVMILRARQERRWSLLTQPRTKVHANSANAIAAFGALLDGLQFAALPLIASRSFPVSLQFVLLILAPVTSPFVPMIVISSMVLFWIVLSGYFGYAMYMQHPHRAEHRRTHMPFLTIDFISNKPYMLPLMTLFTSHAFFGIVVAVCCSVLACPEGVLGGVSCWTSHEHRSIGMLAVISLIIYVPTAAYYGVLLLGVPRNRSALPLDITTTALFELVHRFIKVFGISIAVFAAKGTYTIVVLFLALSALLVAHLAWRPCQHIPAVNSARSIIFACAWWSCVAAWTAAQPWLVIASVIVLGSGWGVIIFFGTLIHCVWQSRTVHRPRPRSSPGARRANLHNVLVRVFRGVFPRTAPHAAAAAAASGMSLPRLPPRPHIQPTSPATIGCGVAV